MGVELAWSSSGSIALTSAIADCIEVSVMTWPSTTAARSGPAGPPQPASDERGTDGERRHGAANRESHEQSFRGRSR